MGLGEKTASRMENSKRMLKRFISLQHGRTDRLHALRIATQRGGTFISEANGHIDVRCMSLIALKLFVSNLFVYIVYNICVLCNGAGGKA